MVVAASRQRQDGVPAFMPELEAYTDGNHLYRQLVYARNGVQERGHPTWLIRGNPLQRRLP
jgi:hypothetical protein